MHGIFFKYLFNIYLILGNTLFCWPENELHGTTALPTAGVTYNLSQNLAKRTVTAIKKWHDGSEKKRHFEYRLNQLQQDLPALNAMLKSIGKNKKINEVILEGNIEYEGEHINLNTNDREWAM
jgi:hypothetical protein